MKKYTIKLFWAFTFLVLLHVTGATPVQADTDGYFCVGNGYLALELSSFKTSGLKASHILRFVRFGPEGISPIQEIALDDFMTQRMICQSDRVELSGWKFDDSHYEEYSIDISRANGLRIAAHNESETGWTGSREGFSPRNIEYMGPSVTMKLDSADVAHTFELRVRTVETQASPVEFRLDTTGELLELDSRGNVLYRVVLYKNVTVDSPD
jgi:hypothetical protein